MRNMGGLLMLVGALGFFYCSARLSNRWRRGSKKTSCGCLVEFENALTLTFSRRIGKGRGEGHSTFFSVILFTTSAAAAKPNAPVTNVAVP